MELFRLADVIGQEIAEVRTHYIPADNDKEYSMPLIYTYIKLTTNQIIGIPNSDEDYFHVLTPEDQERLQQIFNNSNFISEEDSKIVTGQKIVEVLFCYENGEPAYEYSAYFKLSNGYYLNEINYAWVPFRLLDDQRFLAEKIELARRLNIDIRSFIPETHG